MVGHCKHCKHVTDCYSHFLQQLLCSLMEACFSGQNDVVHLIRLATDASWLTEDKFGEANVTIV